MTQSAVHRGIVDLSSELGLLKVHGPEAAAFLQAQLTNDVQALAPGAVRLAGYCSPKGRLLGSFWIWRDPASGQPSADTFWLVCSRGLAPALAKRLAMFVLRAKLKVEDASATRAMLGAVAVDGTPPTAPLPDGCAWHPIPPVSLPAASRTLMPELAPADGSAPIARWLAAVPPDVAAPLAAIQPAAERLALAAWLRLEVLSGIARILPGNQELFVPQMANFERVGGVDFRKGCYPGQEVVARSQYLGKLKRRAALASGAGPVPEPGADVRALAGPADAEPIGQVINAAPLADGSGFVVLFEHRTDAAAADPAIARIGSAVLTRLPLPYTLLDAPAPTAGATPATAAG